MLRPSHKDDFLERTKAAREERQLEKIRGKMEGREHSGRHGVAPCKKLREGTERTPCCAPLTRMNSWVEPRQPGRRDSWRKYEVSWKDGNRADARCGTR
jgi:hypothetical protein